MNARSYRVGLKLSPVDFPPIIGLGQSSIFYQSEPKITNNKIILEIIKKYVLTDMATNKENEVLTTQSLYEIPLGEIKEREDVYEFYKDATLSLSEAYQYARTQLLDLPNINFPNQPIENYQGEIDRVFSLLISRN